MMAAFKEILADGDMAAVRPVWRMCKSPQETSVA
jgi:hypothetical protein